MEKSQHSYRAGAQHTSLQQVVMCVVICVVMCIFTCVSVPRRRQHAHFLYFVLFFFKIGNLYLTYAMARVDVCIFLLLMILFFFLWSRTVFLSLVTYVTAFFVVHDTVFFVWSHICDFFFCNC